MDETPESAEAQGSPKGRPSNRRVGHSIVALGSAVVFAVYAAGYVRTRAAAERFSDEALPRRITVPGATATALTTVDQPGPEATAVRTDRAAKPRVGEPGTSVAASQSVPEIRQDAPARNTDREPATATNPAARGALDVVIAAPATSPSLATAAAVPSEATTPVAAPDASKTAEPTPQSAQWKDGTYSGWGTSRHGDIQASVVIAGGRIVSASITQCLTRYSCSWIDHLPPQVVSRQSPEVDYVSGATQSSNAFYTAVVEALTKASRTISLGDLT